MHENECLAFLQFFLAKFKKETRSKFENVYMPLSTLIYTNGYCHACYSMPRLEFDDLLYGYPYESVLHVTEPVLGS